MSDAMQTSEILFPPAWLTGASADIWRELAWSFFSAGYLTEQSRDLFAAYSQVVALRQELGGWMMSRECSVFMAPDGPCTWPETEVLPQVGRRLRVCSPRCLKTIVRTVAVSNG